MVLQAFIDESEDNNFFVMAGYVAHVGAWAEFTREWELLLPSAPLSKGGTHQFKMRDMAAFEDRMALVPGFHAVIQKYAEVAVSVQFRPADLRSAISRITVPGAKLDWAMWENRYVFAFRALTDVLNRRRAEIEPMFRADEVIDFVFDERSEKAKIVAAWDSLRGKLPSEQAALYGKTPRFEDDEEFLPLQAADFWAWWIRRQSTERGEMALSGVDLPWKHDREKPPQLFALCDEDGIIEYLSGMLRPMLDEGHSIVVLPPQS